MDPMCKLGILDSAGITGKTLSHTVKLPTAMTELASLGWAPILEGLPVGARGHFSRNLHSCLRAIDSEEPEGSNPCRSQNSGWHYLEPNQDWTGVSRPREFSSSLS